MMVAAITSAKSEKKKWRASHFRCAHREMRPLFIFFLFSFTFFSSFLFLFTHLGNFFSFIKRHQFPNATINWARGEKV